MAKVTWWQIYVYIFGTSFIDDRKASYGNMYLHAEICTGSLCSEKDIRNSNIINISNGSKTGHKFKLTDTMGTMNISSFDLFFFLSMHH